MSRQETRIVKRCVHEFEILNTEDGEYYFVLALFGLELTINFGGPPDPEVRSPGHAKLPRTSSPQIAGMSLPGESPLGHSNR